MEDIKRHLEEENYKMSVMPTNKHISSLELINDFPNLVNPQIAT